MGRVVKGVQLRVERYQLTLPEAPAPAQEPVAHVDDGAAPFGLSSAELERAVDGNVPPIDVEALHAQAQIILDDATRHAEELLADAHNRARTLVEDAAARADAIALDARKRGHDEGFQVGRDAADREMNEMLVTMRGLLEMARAERHKLMQEAEPELVRLALGIAERVLHQQVALDRAVVVEMAKTAIARLIERDRVTVRVNPADLERMREHREELMAIGEIRNLRIVEDQRVDRGGVVVDTDAGTIDARIATQLEETRKVLHIDDDVIVEPAPPDVSPRIEIPRAS